MKTAVIALTKKGAAIAAKIGRLMDADIYVKNDVMERVIIKGEVVVMHPFSVDFRGMIEKMFSVYDALVFVMACGIVVRSIAPYIKDKRTDPAVVVVDELGRFAISLLSGHIGGANRLAGIVADILGGIAVVTTATDINGVIAFDELAAENDCAIENINDLKYISSELVNGGNVCLFSDCRLNGVLPPNIQPYAPESKARFAVVLSNSLDVPVTAEKTLYLRPKNLILGIGCKKGKQKHEIQEAVENFLSEKNKKSILSVRCVSSIELKAGEKGILEFCKERNIPFKTFSAENIREIEHRFPVSDFVRKTAGVGCVAEACAVLAGNVPRLICRKTAYNGITLALAEEEKVIAI